MKRARSGKAFARLRALSVQVLGRSQRDQLKHARNDHACMLRLRVARSGNAGSGRWAALEGAVEARAQPHARSLALQRCVQGAGARAGRCRR